MLAKYVFGQFSLLSCFGVLFNDRLLQQQGRYLRHAHRLHRNHLPVCSYSHALNGCVLQLNTSFPDATTGALLLGLEDAAYLTSTNTGDTSTICLQLQSYSKHPFCSLPALPGLSTTIATTPALADASQPLQYDDDGVFITAVEVSLKVFGTLATQTLVGQVMTVLVIMGTKCHSPQLLLLLSQHHGLFWRASNLRFHCLVLVPFELFSLDSRPKGAGLLDVSHVAAQRTTRSKKTVTIDSSKGILPLVLVCLL